MTIVKLRERIVYLVFCMAACTPCLASNASSDIEQNKRAVEYTFLQSAPGQREALKKFIVANWFAMDDVAIAKGLMESYQLLDSGQDADAWNVVVAVTYKNRAGYEGITTEFENIRRTHKPVLVDGKSLKDLGKIVMSRKLYRD